MARPPSLKPSYCHDKTNGVAYVCLCGRKHTLGPYGSRKSRDRYDQLIGEWIQSGRAPLPRVNAREAGARMTISTLVNEWLKWARTAYGAEDTQPGRVPRGELGNYWTPLSELRRLFGDKPAAEFGPASLRALAQEMTHDRTVSDPRTGLPLLRRGLCRNVIIHHVKRVRSIFKWAKEQDPRWCLARRSTG